MLASKTPCNHYSLKYGKNTMTCLLHIFDKLIND